jgi:pyruvate decarboxylase
LCFPSESLQVFWDIVKAPISFVWSQTLHILFFVFDYTWNERDKNTTMTRTISLTKYLFTRLKQQGLKEVFGVPGDFTLKSIDHAQELGLRWIGNCNELSAGYAADGYARSKGLAVLSTTLGVGELSAINATACSYAEHVPVVHVVGSPARPLQESTGVIHHTLGDGRNKHVFMDLQKSITVACTALWDAHSAPKIIDDTIVECLRQSRPVYIDLPCDMVSEEVPEERLDEALKIEVPVCLRNFSALDRD